MISRGVTKGKFGGFILMLLAGAVMLGGCVVGTEQEKAVVVQYYPAWAPSVVLSANSDFAAGQGNAARRGDAGCARTGVELAGRDGCGEDSEDQEEARFHGVGHGVWVS